MKRNKQRIFSSEFKLKVVDVDMDEAQAEIERLKLELAESRLRIRLLEEMSKKRNKAKGHNRHNTSSDC